MLQTNKTIPIGIEFYKEMIDNDYYYVDKTLLIRDLIEQKNKVILFTRPRRFGKTLAQSTIRTFFEQEVRTDGTRIDNSRYFLGKKIMDAGDKYTRHMGQYPVISISMKSAKQPDFKTAYEILENGLPDAIGHIELIKSERSEYCKIIDALFTQYKQKVQV